MKHPNIQSNQSRAKWLAFPTLALIAAGACAALAIPDANANPVSSPSVLPMMGNEVMTDRCSGEVAFPTTYNGKVDDKGTLMLKRDDKGRTEWSRPFTVKTSNAGRIRWFCRSQSQWGFMDPGAWTFSDKATRLWCADKSEKYCIEIPDGTSAVAGWYPERSRCDSRTTRVRARLGPNRLLQIECLPKPKPPKPKTMPKLPFFPKKKTTTMK